MFPEQELKLDMLLHNLALVIAERQKDRALQERILASLERIERAHAIPMLFSLRQACARLGMSERWGRAHPELLPAPVSFRPLRYRVSDVEALAEHGLPKMGHRGRRAKAS